MMSKTPGQVAEGFRLSPQQRRLWRLHEAYFESAFGVQCSVRIKGTVNPSRLDQAIAQVEQQYEILRTKFALLENTDVPVQVVKDGEGGLSQVVHLMCDNEARRREKIEQIEQKQFRCLHDVHRNRLFSFVLIVSPDDNDHVLVVTASGLCADATSLINIVRQVYRAYFNEAHSEDNVLQYADLAEWQNQLLEDLPDDDRQPYWKAAEFSDLLFPRLPFEFRNSSNAPPSCLEVLRRNASGQTVIALQALAESRGLPLQSILLAAWAIILYRWSGMERFLAGVKMEGREQQELRGAVGPFAKFLPLDIHLENNPSFTDLLAQIDTSLRIANYDQLSFDWEPFGVLEASTCRHTYPTLFSSHELSSIDSKESVWEIRSIVEVLEPSHLALTAVKGADSLTLAWSWESSTFSRADSELIGATYLALLSEIAENPDCRAMEFRMGGTACLSTPESLEIPPETTLHELIEEWSLRMPERIAVVCEEEQITYRELTRRASVLAGRLDELGVSPDSVVALMAERSVDSIVGMLAALKARAAWLPLDPGMPDDRVKDMLGQSRTAAILTQRGLAQAHNYDGFPTVYLDEDGESASSLKNQSQRCSNVDPCQLAYVIFTSGSTGRPKGVAIEHRQVMAYIAGLAAKVTLNDCHHFALVSTTAADLGHTSIFAALTSGGCLHVIPASRTLDADALTQYFLQHPVDFVKIVPAHLESLCRLFPKSTRLPWQYLFIGGELLTADLVEQVQACAPDCSVFNHYGPTETTIGVLCGPVDLKSDPYKGNSVPVGTSFAHAAAYVLNDQLQPVPAWIPGNLYIGGAQVGRGYIGRGDLTAERFIPDPFHIVAGSRMYDTGDLARRRSDGRIEFLGRKDGQVKIRGYRVELGEVEAALRRHPAVQNAVVILAEDMPSVKYLVGWAAVGRSNVNSEELRAFLLQSLPEYMVPARLTCVERIQLTPNGKIDRQALPAASRQLSRSQPSLPLDAVEENLLAVWQKVLGMEKIGVDDNYFSLGGDSLRVIQMVHEARRYGITIGATEVLRSQTIRNLRRAIAARVHHSMFPEGIPPLPPSLDTRASVLQGVVDCYAVSGMQHFMLEKYMHNVEDGRAIFHIQDCTLLRDPDFSFEALEKAFQAVVARHPVLRTTFDLESSPPVQYVHTCLPWTIERKDIASLPPEEQKIHIAAALAADLAAPFDARDRQKPLFRIAIYLRSATEFNLIFSCHHAIMDGWSHRVFFNQVVQAYLAIKAGATVDLGQPDATYREFVAIQEAVAQSDKAAAFWQRYLANEIPPVRAGGSVPEAESSGSEILCALEPELVGTLVSAARSWAVSMQALLLSAWCEALRIGAGLESVVVGVVVNGRSEHLTDPLSAVGLFWNIVPVISRSASSLLGQATAVQKDLLEMEPYSAFPLPKILGDRTAEDFLFSAFRYLNFWNTRELPGTSGLELLDLHSYDRYPFPMTCSASVNSITGGGFIQLEYDSRCVPAGRARTLFDCYHSLLHRIASSPEDVTQ